MPTLKTKKKWCYWHIRVKDSNNWNCAAHLSEGRVFDCPHKNSKNSQQGKYPCLDHNYKPVEKQMKG